MLEWPWKVCVLFMHGPLLIFAHVFFTAHVFFAFFSYCFESMCFTYFSWCCSFELDCASELWTGSSSWAWSVVATLELWTWPYVFPLKLWNWSGIAPLDLIDYYSSWTLNLNCSYFWTWMLISYCSFWVLELWTWLVAPPLELWTSTIVPLELRCWLIVVSPEFDWLCFLALNLSCYSFSAIGTLIIVLFELGTWLTIIPP